MISITQMVINWEILQLSKHNSQELYLITRSFDNKGNYKKCFVDTVRSKKIDGGGALCIQCDTKLVTSWNPMVNYGKIQSTQS